MYLTNEPIFSTIYSSSCFRSNFIDKNYGQLGALNTVALIILTAIVGIYFAKIQGIQTLKSVIQNLYQNRMPVYEIMSGTSIAIAALLLIIPGFFTDFLGFLLLVPFTRKLLFKLALKKNSQKEHEDQNKTLEGEIVDNKKDDT